MSLLGFPVWQLASHERLKQDGEYDETIHHTYSHC